MGRRRKHDLHLPRRMYRRRGVYFYCHRDGSWENMGRDYGAALIKYAGIVGEAPKVSTIRDLLSQYIEFSVNRLKPATIANYRISAVNLCEVFAHVAVTDLGPDDVYRYVSTIGNVQANRDRALLSAAYTHGRRIGALPRGFDDPTKGLQYRNPETPKSRYVTDDEMDQLVAAASPRLGCIARFIELTGMRQGDALRVKMTDLDDEGFTYWNSKGKKWQGLQWSDELTTVVEDAKRLWRRFGREWLFESRPRGRYAKRGIGPYTPSGIRNMWRKERAKSGIDDVTLHDLRGKAASDMDTDEQARELLGHDDSRTTRKHYRRKVKRSKPVR